MAVDTVVDGLAEGTQLDLASAATVEVEALSTTSFSRFKGEAFLLGASCDKHLSDIWRMHSGRNRSWATCSRSMAALGPLLGVAGCLTGATQATGAVTRRVGGRSGCSGRCGRSQWSARRPGAHGGCSVFIGRKARKPRRSLDLEADRYRPGTRTPCATIVFVTESRANTGPRHREAGPRLFGLSSDALDGAPLERTLPDTDFLVALEGLVLTLLAFDGRSLTGLALVHLLFVLLALEVLVLTGLGLFLLVLTRLSLL